MNTLFADNDDRTSPLHFLTSTPSRALSDQPATLIDAIQAAAQLIEESRLHPLISKRANWMPPPRSFLALLTYCYAQQTYASSQIVHFLSGEETFRRAGPGEIPSAQEIRLFRWYNRWAIEKCLAAALHFLSERQPNSLVAPIQESFVAEEAKRRIIMAACIDDLESGKGNPFLIAA